MRCAPATEEDKAAKAALYTRYVEALPAALGSWQEAGRPDIVFLLLAGMREVVAAAPAAHQTLFRCYFSNCHRGSMGTILGCRLAVCLEVMI